MKLLSPILLALALPLAADPDLHGTWVGEAFQWQEPVEGVTFLTEITFQLRPDLSLLLCRYLRGRILCSDRGGYRSLFGL